MITSNTYNNNIDISNENIIDMYNNECPICLEDFGDTNEFIIVDCCKKKLHIKCIVDWYTIRPNNKYCFMCNQENIFCKDFFYNTNLEIDNSNIITINNDNIITINNDNNLVNNNNISKYDILIYYIKISTVIIFIVIFITVLIYTIIKKYLKK